MKKQNLMILFLSVASLVSCKEKSKSVQIELNLSKNEENGVIVLDETQVSGDIDIFLKGTMDDGGIQILSNGKDSVNIFLNCVNINSSEYPCIEIKKGSPVNIYLNGKNTLTDGRTYGKKYGTKNEAGEKIGSDSSGTLYSKGSINFFAENKTASLTINENYEHCISSKKDIVINGGIFNLNSTGRDGINALTSFTMNGGTLNISGTGENINNQSRGIIVKGTDDAKKGYDGNGFIKINDGIINIRTYGKAISAKWKVGEDESKSEKKVEVDPSIYIYGGKFNIETYGQIQDKMFGEEATFTDSEGKTVTEVLKCAPEGIEAKKNVNIYGGDFTICTTDDAINSSTTGNNINIYGGSLYLSSSMGDGLDSNGNILIEGGKLVAEAVMQSEHALDCGEGYKLTINGGNVLGISGTDFIEGDWSDSKQKYLNLKSSKKRDSFMPPPPQFDNENQTDGKTNSANEKNWKYREAGQFREPPDNSKMPSGMNFAGGRMPPPPQSSPANMISQDFPFDKMRPPLTKSENTIVLEKEKVSSIAVLSETSKVLAACKILTESFGFITLSTPELNDFDSEKGSIKLNATVTGGEDFHGLWITD